MKERFRIALLLIFGVAALVRAQSIPDLSGTWVPVGDVNTAAPPAPARTDGPPPPPAPPRTLSMTFMQTATQLTIDRRLEVAGAQTIETATYKFDGSETTRQMGVLVFTTRVGWQGDVLVMSSAVSAESNAVGQLTERYRLVDDNLVVDATRTSPAGTFTSRTVHARKQ